MAFKMKNPSLMKMAKQAGSAMKLKQAEPMQMKSAPMKKTYKEAYAGLSDTQKKKYKGESDFINQAKLYNQKKYGTTEPSKKEKQFKTSRTEMEKIAKPKKIASKTKDSTPRLKTAKATEKLISSKTVDIKNPRSNKKTVVMDKQRKDGTSVKIKDKFKTGKSGATIDTKRSGILANVRKGKYKKVEKDAQGNRVSITKTTKKYDKEGKKISEKRKTRKAFGQTKVGKFLKGENKK